MLRTIPLSIIRSSSLYTRQWYMSYRFTDSLRAGSGRSVLILLASCQQICMTYTIGVCTVKNSWWWTEELSEAFRVSLQNKFEKSVHLLGFIIRIYHDARSLECQFITMHGHLNVNLSRCTVTWTSNRVFIKEAVKPQQFSHSLTLYRLSVLRNEHLDYKKYGPNTSNIKNIL